MGQENILLTVYRFKNLLYFIVLLFHDYFKIKTKLLTQNDNTQLN